MSTLDARRPWILLQTGQALTMDKYMDKYTPEAENQGWGKLSVNLLNE